MVKPFIAGSDSAKGFLEIGMKILKSGGPALDAVEATCRAVGSNPEDHGVGLGGTPNINGQVTLDASIMDGRTLNAGAVAHVEGFLHVISVARRVMEDSPHVLLVGKGAELFAEKMGFKRVDLLTDYSREFYEAFKNDMLGELGPEFSEDIEYYMDDKRTYDMFEVYRNYKDHMWGTVNVMAIDMNGDIATGVTTSGTYLKLPGRVGDSPLIGAGNYCDNRHGAAACTGIGELAIRHGTARNVVTYMKMGMTPEKACMEAIREINEMNEYPVLNVIAITPDGQVAAASTDENEKFYYMSEDMVEVEKTRIWIK